VEEKVVTEKVAKVINNFAQHRFRLAHLAYDMSEEVLFDLLHGPPYPGVWLCDEPRNLQVGEIVYVLGTMPDKTTEVAVAVIVKAEFDGKVSVVDPKILDNVEIPTRRVQ